MVLACFWYALVGGRAVAYKSKRFGMKFQNLKRGNTWLQPVSHVLRVPYDIYFDMRL